jgi:hypothetical protein
MPSMIATIVIGLGVLWAVVRLSQRFGFKRVMEFAGMISLVIPPFVLAGAIVLGVLNGVKAPSLTARIVIGSVVVLAARLISRKVGWVNVLGWTFSLAMAFCGVVIMLFLLTEVGVAIHATASGLVFIIAGTGVLYAIAHGTSARGR